MTKVLIVDDNEQNLYMLQVLLEGHGYEVILAQDGIDALGKARRNPPAAIVSDILMPGMDGFALCREWKQDEVLKSIPFIFYTATYTDPKDEAFAKNLGADRFLVKPVDPAVFVALLQEVLMNNETGELNLSGDPVVEEGTFIKEYNEALIRKLEDKMMQLEKTNRRLLMLQKVSAAMSSSLDLEDALQHIGQGAIDALNSSAVWILVINEDDKTLNSKVMVSAVSEDIASIEQEIGMLADGISIPLIEGQNWLSDVVISGKPIFIPDISNINRETHQYDIPSSMSKITNFKALAVIPLVVRDKVVGVMALARTEIGEISDDEMQLITAFSHQASVAIENAQLYEEQQQHANCLEAEVAARTSELSVALEKAQDAERLKSQFLSDVNHELRTPLNSIMLYLGLLERGKPENRSRYMTTINREIKQLQRLIEDLLDISRLDVGEQAANLEAVDINSLVGNLITSRGILATDRGMTLDFEQNVQIPLALADPQSLFQVFTNLLANAINYTPNSGAIMIKTDVKSSEGSEWVTIRIEDTGLGISDEDKLHLFERFYRGSAGRESGTPGTGLGLAISKEIIDRHGGRIELESEEGNGSIFTIWLQSIDKEVMNV